MAMTSASDPSATSDPVRDTARIDAVARSIATDWPIESYAMISELYTALADLPARYTADERAAIIDTAADLTAGDLSGELDDIIYQVHDRPPVSEICLELHGDELEEYIVARLHTHAAGQLTWWLTGYLDERLEESRLDREM